MNRIRFMHWHSSLSMLLTLFLFCHCAALAQASQRYEDSGANASSVDQSSSVPRSADVPPSVAPSSQKLTLAGDFFFDSRKTTLDARSMSLVDSIAQKASVINLEVIIMVGHTDSKEVPVSQSQKLSEQRALALKSAFLKYGIEPARLYTEGKGSHQPVADNKTAEGRAKNRRVELEVVGTR